MRFWMRPGTLLAVAATSLVIALVSLGTLAWIVADPQYWFPGAYAERGERGSRGPRGAQGPVGPPGPVGPDAVDAVNSVDYRVDELEARLDDLETGSGDEADASVDDIASRLDALCAEFYYYPGAFEEIYYAAC